MKVQIENELRKHIPGNITLPSEIIFSAPEDRSVLTMTMSKAIHCGLAEKNPKTQKMDYGNMQVDGAAFEGWALALYTHWMGRKGTVVLDVDPSFTARLQDDNEIFHSNGHYGRFLYRALRFSSQYEWFKLSEPVSRAVERFLQRLMDGDFVNNIGNNLAGQKKKLESQMEKALSEGDKAPFLRKQLDLNETDPIYRQFPVGMMQLQRALNAKEMVCIGDEKLRTLGLNGGSANSRIFTGGSSAMDLWAIRGDTLCTIELKAKRQMMGALTEIFFYSNYMHDLYVDPIPSVQLLPPKKNRKNDRGYSVIRNLSQQGELKQIEGILLLDPKSLHPLMTSEVMETMNQSTRKGIRYRIVSYES